MSFQIDFPAQPRFPILAPAGSASAPSYALADFPGTGFYSYGGGVMGLAIAGTYRWSFAADGLTSNSSAAYLLLWDSYIVRDAAANTLAMRNGANPQTLRVYNTYTDASNYERGRLEWAANVLTIGTQKAGTGIQRQMVLSAARVTIGNDTTGTNYWYFDVDNTGALRASTDNAYDIGASGATRPRSIYAGTTIETETRFQFRSATRLVCPSNGVLTLTNAAEGDFTRLQFGGTTSSFPSLKRNTTTIDFRLADDSGYCGLAAGTILTSGSIGSQADVSSYTATAIPPGGTAGKGFKLSSTTNFGVFFGSGAPTLSAAKGSLYLRSDGSTTNDRIYVNTDGSTAWTAVTTAT